MLQLVPGSRQTAQGYLWREEGQGKKTEAGSNFEAEQAILLPKRDHPKQRGHE